MILAEAVVAPRCVTCGGFDLPSVPHVYTWAMEVGLVAMPKADLGDRVSTLLFLLLHF